MTTTVITLIDSPTQCASAVSVNDDGNVEIELTHNGVTMTVGLAPNSARVLSEAIQSALMATCD